MGAFAAHQVPPWMGNLALDQCCISKQYLRSIWHLQYPDMAREKPFTRTHAVVVVRNSAQDHIVHALNAKELSRIALEALVRELGTEGARLYLRKEFAEYLRDYRGDGRDDRPPRLVEVCASTAYRDAHSQAPKPT